MIYQTFNLEPKIIQRQHRRCKNKAIKWSWNTIFYEQIFNTVELSTSGYIHKIWESTGELFFPCQREYKYIIWNSPYLFGKVFLLIIFAFVFMLEVPLYFLVWYTGKKYINYFYLLRIKHYDKQQANRLKILNYFRSSLYLFLFSGLKCPRKSKTSP